MRRYIGPFNRVTKTDIVTPEQEITAQMVKTYPPAAPAYSFYEGILPAETQYYDSYRTPQFEKLKEDGWIVQCPFTLSRVSTSIVPGNISVTYGIGTSPLRRDVLSNFCTYIHPQLRYGWVQAFDMRYIASRNPARDEALTRVFSKANTPNADLLIELSQLKQTVAMFVKLAKTLVAMCSTPGAFLDLAKAHLRGSERYVRIPPSGMKVPVTSLEGLWCELRFGWRPLLASLQGIIEALNRTDLDKSKRVTYRASEDVDDKKENVTIANTTYSNGCLVVDEPAFRHTETLRYTANFRAGILLEESNTLLGALGLDKRYIPIAVWDLVPYSFIVDRFVNVGNYIRSLRPIPSNQFGGAWVAERFTVEHGLHTEFLSLSKSCGTGTAYRSFTRSPGYCEGTTKIEGYVRTIHDTPPPLPTLRHDWSELQNIYNLVDAVMLAIQLARPRILRGRN